MRKESIWAFNQTVALALKIIFKMNKLNIWKLGGSARFALRARGEEGGAFHVTLDFSLSFIILSFLFIHSILSSCLT